MLGEISDTKKIGKNIYLHFLKNCNFELRINENYFLNIDEFKRIKVSNNHSATHLLHESLRQVVGKHVSQKGSLVNDKKIRFDYSSNEQLTFIKQKRIESLVNNSIRSNIKIDIREMALKKAKESGAMALFGEKYPEVVRVVSMVNPIKANEILSSIELCGGTHVKQTGQIGLFKILSDVSVSSGIRRVEALTGQDAEIYCEEKINSLREIKKILKASDTNVIEKIEHLKKNSLSSKKNIRLNEPTFQDSRIIDKNDYSIYFDDLDCHSKELKNNADLIKKKFKDGIIILTCLNEKKVSVVVSVCNSLIDRFDSNKIIKEIITFLGGKGGGGRRDLCQGGAPLNENFKKLKDNLDNLIV